MMYTQKNHFKILYLHLTKEERERGRERGREEQRGRVKESVRDKIT